MSLTFTIISFILLATILICKDFIDYYEANEPDSDKAKNLKDFVSNVFIINIVLIIIDFYFTFLNNTKNIIRIFFTSVFIR